MKARSSHRGGTVYDVAFYLPFMGSVIAGRRGLVPAGGAETQVFLLARMLAKRGFSVAVIVFDVPGGLPDQYDGVKVIIRKPYAGSLGQLRSPARKLIGMVRESLNVISTGMRTPANLIVQRTASVETGLIALGCRLASRRFAWSSASVSDFDFSRMVTRELDARIFRAGVSMADEVIVQTDEQVEMCHRSFGREATRILSFAEPAEEAPLDRGPLLWIGRIVDYKRPLEFLDIVEATPDIAYRMVAPPNAGGTEEKLSAELAERAARLANLELIEPRPRAEILELIATSTAVVSTSVFEGMPNIFLEGWARGVPAISLHFDPDGAIERHGLGLFAAGDPERLIEGARRIIADRDLRARLSSSCRSYVSSNHDPAVVTDQWARALGLAATAGTQV